MKVSIISSILIPILLTLSSLINQKGTKNFKDSSGIKSFEDMEFKSESYMSTYNDLMDIYNNTAGANWNSNTNWGDTAVPFNQWYGITADANDVVTQINLNNNNLSGTIPSSIGNFSSLEKLYLQSNNLYGSIPVSITSCTNLSNLFLGNNNLTGGIPLSWTGMINLYELSLYDNSLTGGIPGSLGSLSNLAHLSLSNNNLGGTIPSNLGSLTKDDIHLDLSNTGVSGNIPMELGNLDIHLLYLNNNSLSGTIPSNLGNYNYIDFVLNFDDNNLNGCFPASFNTYCTGNNPTITAYGNPNMSVNDLTTFCNNGGNCSTTCSGTDLLVSSITLSSNSIAPGGNINIDFGIKNDCSTNAGSSNQKWYLSTDNTYDAADIELGTYNISNINGNTVHYVNSQSINISANQNTGDYFIIVYADADDDVSENNETNNTDYKAITISNTGGGGGGSGDPDLIIYDEYGSTEVPLNQTIYINCEVKNIGSTNSGTSTLKWYISNTPDLTGIIYSFPTPNTIGSLSPGTSSTRYGNFDLPQTLEIDSSYYVLFRADANDDVSESNENNNLASYEFTVLNPVYNSGSDLAPVTYPTGPANAGDSIIVDCFMSNLTAQGTGTNDAVLRYFLSTNTVYNEGVDIFIGEENIQDAAGNSDFWMNTEVIIPNNTYPGTYYIIGFADANDILDETNENNNKYDRSIVISNDAYKPNLVLTNMDAPVNAKIGGVAQVSYDIKNDGDLNAPYSFSGIYLSDDGNLDANDLFITSNYVSALLTNQLIGKTFAITIPTSVTAGSYHLILKADYQDNVTEHFENDNYNSKAITIVPAPDLEAFEHTPQGISIAAGNSITVNGDFKNIGSLDAVSSDIGYFINEDRALTSIYIGTEVLPNLAINQVVNISKTIDIPNDLNTGMHFISIKADYNDVIEEVSETNNNTGIIIDIIHQEDLVVLNETCPSTGTTGANINLSCNVFNAGSQSCPASLVSYYISTDDIWDNNDIFLAEDSISVLSVNQLENSNVTVSIPDTLTDGDYFILFRCDDDDVVNEFNENNNLETLSINITTNNCPYETSSLVEELCDGETYYLNGNPYSSTGIYVDTIISTGAGCDTIVTVDLTVWPTYSIITNESICDNETYVFNGATYDTTGTYIDSLLSVNNCDSILTLNLTVNPTYTSTINETICDGDSYTFNGIDETDAGTYYDTVSTINYCDSIIILNLAVDPLETATLNESICDGEIYTFNGIDYDTTGIYTDTISNPGAGCDTIYTIDITSFPTYSETLVENVCEGESYLLNGNTYTETGTYTETLTTVNACDSNIILDLTVNPLNESTFYESICQGDTYNATNGNSYSVTGVYLLDTVPATGSACDTIITLDLTVHSVYQDTLNEEICEGATYEFDGVSYSTSGTYTANLTSINNCDSIVTLNLTVLNLISTNLVEEICDNETFLFNGNSYNTTVIIVDTLIGTGGDCDTIATLDLTVFATYSDTTIATICSNETYDFNGTSYTASGVYTQTETNSTNCDSLLILDLTVDSVLENTINEEICEGDSILFNSSYYSTSGTYQDTLSNPTGCDSVISLVLTVELLDKSTVNKTLCFGDTCSFLGNEYSTSGTYKHFVNNPNSALCDSLVTLELTVLTAAESNCTNYSNAGSISYPEALEVTEETFDPNLIESESEPSGGQCGDNEFQWQLKLESVNIWEDIAGANSSDYDPITIMENTCFRRNARRSCQENWVSSNEICFELDFCSNYIDGGVLDHDGELSTTAAYLDPGIIYEDIEPSGGGGDGTDYQWQEKVGNGSWFDIDGVISIDFSPDTLITNTCYRRKVTKTCVGEWVLSNEICFEILNCQNVSGPGSIVYPGINKANLSIDPDPIIGDIPPGGNGGQVVYQWQKSDINSWEDIGGASSQNYDPPIIYQNTCFRRGATIECNENYLFTTEVCFEIKGCENYTDPGFLSYDGYTGFATSIDPILIEGTVPSGGGGGNQEYIWEEQLDFSGVWSTVSNATGQNYDPPQFTETRCFRRKARIDCQVNWETSLEICFVNCTTEAINNGVSRSEQTVECQAFIDKIMTETFDCCYGENMGEIDISGIDDEPYEVIWNTGATTLNLKNLYPGNYCTTIVSTALESCFYTNCFTIQEMCFNAEQDISIIINEVSNGSSSGEEFVELLILGTNDCQPIDIRGFIIDDNNGTFNQDKESTPSGFSQGHIRFSNDNRLSQLFPGSIILIYNHLNKNRSITFADDPYDEDNDGVYIMPTNASTLIGNSKLPSINAQDSYELSKEYEKAKWENIWLFDYYDGIQIRNPDGSFHFGLSYGTEIKIAGGPDQLLIKDSNLKGQAIFFSGHDYLDKNSFMYAPVASAETPGFPNSNTNKLFINNLDCEEDTSGAVSDDSQKLSFRNYPNPFTDDFILEVNSEKEIGLEILVYDLLGNNIITERIEVRVGKNNLPIKFSDHISSGAYYLIVKSKQEMLFSQKIIRIK